MAAWFDTVTLIQHSGVGSLGIWDGLLISYRGIIEILVYFSTILDAGLQTQPLNLLSVYFQQWIGKVLHKRRMYFSIVGINFVVQAVLTAYACVHACCVRNFIDISLLNCYCIVHILKHWNLTT